MTRFRRTLFTCAAILLGLTLAFALVEVSLRLVLPRFFAANKVLPNLPGRFRFHNAHGDVLVEINELGLRGPLPKMHLGEERSGITRLAFLGDSSTWGEAVTLEDTYPDRTCSQLHESDPSNRSYECINLGRPGAGILDYLHYFDSLGTEIGPDILVIGLYLGNDMMSVREPYLVPSVRAIERPGPILRGKRALRGFYTKRIQALRVLSMRLSKEPTDLFEVWFGKGEEAEKENPLSLPNLVQRGKREGLDEKTVKARLARIPSDLHLRALAYDLDPWLFSAAVLHPQSAREGLELSSTEVLTSFAQAEEALDSLITKIRKAGILPVVLLIPRGEQVGERYQREAQEIGFDLSPTAARLTRPQDRLTAFFAKRHVQVVDPLLPLRDAEHALGQTGERIYFPYDAHLTPRGNRVLAQCLSTAIRSIVK